METAKDFFTETKEELQGYLDDRIVLLKLQATEKAAVAGGALVSAVLGIVCAISFLVVLGIFGGYFFSSLTGNTVSGFGIITGIYLALLVVVLLVRKKIESSIGNKIIRSLMGGSSTKSIPVTDEYHYN